MRTKISIGLSFLLFCAINLLAQPNNPALVNKIGYYEVGMASYYPGNEDKRKTLSGEVYEMNAMEAAHKSMPFGALVKVTNLENQKEVVLRINDRPNTTERIMDMTLAAAEGLGMIKEDKALIPVKVEIIALGVPRTEDTRKYLATAPKSKDETKPEQTTEKVAEKTTEKVEKATEKATEKTEKANKLAAKETAQATAKEKAKVEKEKKIAENQAKKAEKLAAEKVAKEKKQAEKAEKEKQKLAAKQQKEQPKAADKATKAEPKATEKATEKTTEKATLPTSSKTESLFQAEGNYSIEGKKQSPTGLGVQTGNFTELARAIDEAKTIEAMKIGNVYIQTTTDKGKTTYKVLVGNFKTKDDAKEILKLLTEKKYSPFTKKY